MKNDPVQIALSRLDEVDPRTPEGRNHFAKALSGKSNLVAAKAARIAGELQVADLRDELAAAFDRFLRRGAEGDKGCAATISTVRALYALDYDEPELYLRGIHHVQKEASFGPPVDTAAELRAVCAMGLASSRYPARLTELVDLLVDPEWQARAGAVRAIAAVGSESASLLLRLKALSGDKEIEVVAECFNALLEVDGAAALPLVQKFAMCRDAGISEAAILALGSSRHPAAIDWLMLRFDEVANSEARKCILLALSTSRTESAIKFILETIRHKSEQMSAAAVTALDIHRDDRIREQVKDALRHRSAQPGP